MSGGTQRATHGRPLAFGRHRHQYEAQHRRSDQDDTFVDHGVYGATRRTRQRLPPGHTESDAHDQQQPHRRTSGRSGALGSGVLGSAL